MKTLSRRLAAPHIARTASSKCIAFAACVFSALFVTRSEAVDQDGIYKDSNAATIQWNSPPNWQANNIAGGTGFTAFFNQATLTTDQVISVDSGRVIGNMIFADPTGTLNSYTLKDTPLTLDVTSGAPTITIQGNGPGTLVKIASNLIGNDGLTFSGTAGSTSGSGVLTLGGTNSYTGVTTITTGTLAIGTVDLDLIPNSGNEFQGSLTATSNVTVNSGGTLLLTGTTANDKINNAATVTLSGGTIKTDAAVSLNETVGALSLTTTSTIDFGTLATGNTLHFDVSDASLWNGTLNVWNWTINVDHLYFGTTSGGLLGANVDLKINLYTDNGATLAGEETILSTGEIYVVPEPSTAFAGLGLLSLIVFRERRWFLRCRDARIA